MEETDYICHFCSEDNLYTDEPENHQLEHIAENTNNSGNTCTIKGIHSDMNVIQERQDTDLYITKSSSNLENCQPLDELMLEERNILESYAYDTRQDKEMIHSNRDPEETALKPTYNNCKKTESANELTANKQDIWEAQTDVDAHNISNRQTTDYTGSAKPRRNTKQKTEKDDILINQKSRILNLENEVKQLRNVLNTHKEGDADIERPTREHPNVGYKQNDCNHKCCEKIQHNDRYKDDVIEQRIRLIEMQMIQNMCITTALNTHRALQDRPLTHTTSTTNGYYPMNTFGMMHPHRQPLQYGMPPQYSAPFTYYPTIYLQSPPDTNNHQFPHQQLQQQYGQNVIHNQGFSQHQLHKHLPHQQVQQQYGQHVIHNQGFSQHQHQDQQQYGQNVAHNQGFSQHQLQHNHFPHQQIQHQYGKNVTHNQGSLQHHQDQIIEFRQHPSQHLAQHLSQQQ
ncbi:MAG: hypothetical protein PSN35_07670, partial [Candidatus Thioglobus sp.]|nr:hypothetical protein [Candidatus Thioglobus sp.]